MIEVNDMPDAGTTPLVYMTTDISAAGLAKAYEALNWEPSGKLAVKLSTGEAGNNHYLASDLVKELIQRLSGTIVECNTAYGGSRADVESHLKVAQDHGFTDIAKVDILDADGSVSLAVTGGKRLTENLIGGHFLEYDSCLVLSHFKGHVAGGFGGALKNISIGIASSEGKTWIHTAGGSRTEFATGDQDAFLDSMAEAAKSIVDHLDGGARMAFINVMNQISVDCDCDGNPAAPDMADIGILASLDPVSLDQACVDLLYSAEDSASVIERIESRNGLRTLAHAENIGVGSREYKLVSLDN